MTRLSCSAINCVNNIEGACTAAVIGVSGKGATNKVDTACETFAPRTLGNAIKNAFNSNYLGVIAQAFDVDHEIGHTIKCNVFNCVYNAGHNCTSTDIQIFGPHAHTSKETDCETYLRRN